MKYLRSRLGAEWESSFSPGREIDPLVNTDRVLQIVILPGKGAKMLVSRYEQIIHSFSYINVSIRVHVFFKATHNIYVGARLRSALNQGFEIGNQNIDEAKEKINYKM